ncbi:unnamed protein product [Diamesa tonsa]
MASNKNGMGMKILWIPGRKRHDRKGIYAPTNKEVNKNYLPQKKNQNWSLGGAQEQKKLMNILILKFCFLCRNQEDDLGASSASAMLSHVSHAAAVGAAGSAIKDIHSDDKINLDNAENSTDKDKIIDKDVLKNGDAACNTDNIDIDDIAYHNAGTIRYRKNNGSNNTDLDSIEKLEFDEEDGKLDDDIDSVSMQRMRTENIAPRRRRRSRNRIKHKELEEPKEKGEKLINCLYVGLMCCECSIQ